MNRLYYGDNLPILRDHIATESADLVYLDPPFNSNATYNVLFKAPSGEASAAQIEAFEDSWHWNESAEEAYWQVLHGQNTEAARMLEAMRGFLGENDMMAYLAMMAARLIELHRVLKPTGSLYLHCDPTASHYLRVMLDAIFGPANFRSELIWRRSPSHNKLTMQFGPIHDTIVFAAKSDKATFHPGRTPYTRSYIEGEFRLKDKRGRYRLNEVMGAGRRGGDSGKPWRGYDPSEKGRHWAIPASIGDFLGEKADAMSVQEQLDAPLDLDLIVLSKTGRPKYKQYPGEGVLLQDIWAYQPGTENTLFETTSGIDEDVKWLSNEEEKLGYPTQKPVGLLERIIAASSNPGDIVLDPFCGCGTTVHAAQKLGRQWIGIDVTHLAISLIERRLREAFPGITFETIGVPQDIGGARALAAKDKHEFQKWAITLIPDAQPWKGGRKGADTGIDGIVYLRTGKNSGQRAIIEVKGGETVGVDVVHKLKSVVEREKALIGLLITLNEPSKAAEREAVSAGFVEVDFGTGTARLRKLQIITVEALMNGERPQLPMIDSTAFRRARREDTSRQEELDL